MRDFHLALDVGASSDPTFIRIARAVSDDIRRGRLRAGQPLPGSRSLAESLGVHRNTVLAAYRELAAEGWIDSEEARGTFVSATIPDIAPRRFAGQTTVTRAMAARPAFEMPELRATPHMRLPAGAMTLGGGVPDVRLVPEAEVARAMRRVLRRHCIEVLSYGDPEGPVVLRRALAHMSATTRGLAAGEEHILVTRGSQMGIYLVARTLVSPGETVVVEGLGYRPAWDAFRAAGARIVSVPVDAHGLDVDALAKLCAEGRVRGIYVTPHHQFPTTVTLAPARRLRLLELAREHRFFVLEDDYNHEFHYEGRPVLPLASADPHGSVIYVSTLSKVLAPGMRIGFVVAPAPLVERLAAMRRIVDRQGDHLLEHAIADLLEEGAIQRHIRRAKRVYTERRAELAALLESSFDGVLSFKLPNGGTAIWTRVVDRDVSLDAWVAAALERGLVLQAAKQFAFDGKPRPFLRIGFAQHDPREAREAIKRMRAALDDVSAKSKGDSARASRAARSSP